MARAIKQDAIPRGSLIWLLTAQAVCILPLLSKLPLWICAIWLLAIYWRVQIHRAKLGFPSFWLKLVLGLVSAAGIYLTYHGVTGIDAMIGFLVCSFILKVIEMRSRKDVIIVLFIGFIAVAAQFLYMQNIAAGLYGLFSLLMLLCAWQAVFATRALVVSKQLREGSMMLAQSLPFMLILFVVMPRVGPLWSVPLPEGRGQTGFSDTLQLGDIGELVKSPAVAFRATFSSVPPSQENMYWRGLALDVFDGRTWRAAERASAVRALPSATPIADHDYTVILEPHNHRWLFSLGVPRAGDSSQLRLLKNAQNLLVAAHPVVGKAQYSVRSTSTDSENSRTLDPAQRYQLTQLPASGNAQARQLAAQWRAQNLSDEGIVEEALALFGRGYEYTLQPPTLGASAIDEFLFSTKQGFCEHFASSFVFLMRAAGVPAQVMVGYLGGEYNQVEDYYAVRQSDAHAWAEVWFQAQGWVRVDPTAVAAPSRSTSGVEDALTESDRRLVGSRSWHSSAMRALYQRYDALEYSWNRWVLNYDNDSQRSLLERLLGQYDPWRVGLAFVAVCSAILAAYAAFAHLRKQRAPATIGQKLLRPVLRRLERRGVSRRADETLGQLAERVRASDPELAEYLTQLGYWYSKLTYAGDRQAVQGLKAKIEELD